MFLFIIDFRHWLSIISFLLTFTSLEIYLEKPHFSTFLFLISLEMSWSSISSLPLTNAVEISIDQKSQIVHLLLSENMGTEVFVHLLASSSTTTRRSFSVLTRSGAPTSVYKTIARSTAKSCPNPCDTKARTKLLELWRFFFAWSQCYGSYVGLGSCYRRWLKCCARRL